MLEDVKQVSWVLPEPKGEPIFIYTNMVGDDGKEYLLTFDSCSSFTLATSNIVGSGVRGCYVNLYHRNVVHGIGGSQQVQNAAILLPLTKNRHQLVYAQVVGELLTNQAAGLDKEARLLKNTCKLEGIQLEGEIDYPNENQPVDILLGCKNMSIFPELVFRTSSGLGVFKCEINYLCSGWESIPDQYL